MSVIIAICAWITLPAAVPFTMQTFGVFFALLLLGGKKGTAAIALYLILGAVGLPVFSGFSGGAGYILGATGGYLLGFLLMGVIYFVFEKIVGSSVSISIAALICGLFVCYLFGTLWFSVYKGDMGFLPAAAVCVVPFVIPDFLKLALAAAVAARVKKALSI